MFKRIHAGLIALTCLLALAAGCMVGPNFKTPPSPTTQQWVEAPPDHIKTDQTVQADWWKVFKDPVLDHLIEIAYQENLNLQVAGLRVLQARAERGIAVGNFFPQLQQINASYFTNAIPSNQVTNATGGRYFDTSAATFSVAWELDVWGKFRRGIESANASLYSSVMNYDDALVTLVADVATTYINLRGLDERIALAQQNVKIQQDSLNIANAKFKAGGTSELDVAQASAQLTNTQSLVPALEQARRQTLNQLCVLLGMPPNDLTEILGTKSMPIPEPPESVAVGIPAELLRRRPDIRAAEGTAAAQSAQIGVAVSELLPHFQLVGTIGYSAENPGDLFRSSNLVYQAGPALQWNILNYGRIVNNVRVQDALFEQAIAQYQNTVLAAQQDVANSITTFIHTRTQSQFLAESVAANQRAVDISMTQYKAGGADFIRVLNATQFLVETQENLVITRINLAASVVSLNRALGGGWELRNDEEFVSKDTLDRMRRTTDWGNITSDKYSKEKDFLLFPKPATTLPANPEVPPGSPVTGEESGEGQ